MPKMLNKKQAGIAKRAKIRNQGTVFTAHCDPQKVGSNGLRAMTYIYPPGSRRTGKPESYKA